MGVMLTTVDNPFDPFEQRKEWYGWDLRAGYDTPGLLARVVGDIDDLSDEEQETAIEDAMDRIVALNASGVHRKVTQPSAADEADDGQPDGEMDDQLGMMDLGGKQVEEVDAARSDDGGELRTSPQVRARVLAMAQLRSVPGLDDDDPVGELSVEAAAIVAALELFDEFGRGDERRKDPLRIPKGHEGGGRFRKITDLIFQRLEDWASGKGPDNPFEGQGFTREHLREAAKARGIPLRRGVSENELVNLLLEDRRGKSGKKPDVAAKDAPTSAPAKKATAVKKATAKPAAEKPSADPAKSEAAGDPERAAERKPDDIQGAERKTLAADVVKRYESARSRGRTHADAIDEIASDLSYADDAGRRDLSPADAQTLVRDLLRESGVGEANGLTKKAAPRKAAAVAKKNDASPDAAKKDFELKAGKAAKGNAALSAAPIAMPDLDGGGSRGFDTLPENEMRALRFFRGEGYRQITPALYRGNARPAVQERIDNLDLVMARSPLERDVVTHRGVADIRKLVGARAARGDLTGVQFTDKAFLSTSADVTQAKFFSRKGAKTADTRPTVLRYLIPEGTRAVKLSGEKHEAELLLDRGLTFRIVADNGVSDDDIRYLDVEVVPA